MNIELMDIEKRIVMIAAEHFDVGGGKIAASARFREDLGADSLDEIELVIAAEEEFDVEITDEEAAPIKTVLDAVALISSKLKK